MSSNVKINDAVKKYGDFTAVNHINLEIKEGEFFTLLGPSGCGKTTLLRMIAGFNSIDEGQIYFGDMLMNRVDAHKRNIGMVFQNYAIFPHLTVEENTAYGLKARKIPSDQIKKRVAEALELVQIEKLKDRKPSELSGGQQQRVALARAFVIEPKILLMDEPLSNLDAKLRVQMRTIIKKLQRRLGITTIYVTHDQEEALAISDRIAVMKEGIIMQTDTPEKIYKIPQNKFVAGFIGVSNFIDCEIAIKDGKEDKEKQLGNEFKGKEVSGNNSKKNGFSESNSKETEVSESNSKGNEGKGNSVNMSKDQHKRYKADITVLGMNYPFTMELKEGYNGKGIISARPEQLYFADKGLEGTIVISTFLGDFVEYEIQLKNGQVLQLNEYTKDASDVKPDGMNVHIGFSEDSIRIYDIHKEEVLS